MVESPAAVSPRAPVLEPSHPPPVDAPRPETRAAAVVLEGVTRRFDDVLAVDGLSLTVPSGVILGLIGPSGSGKTTTLRMMTGALRPDEGRAEVLGQDPTHFDRRTRERIGYLPQLSILFPELTAWENVDFVAALFGMLLPRRMGAVRRVLRVLDLWDHRDRQVGGFSGGMKRRVSLACALVGEPELLFLDEPTTGIDPILRESIWAELGGMRDRGTTMVVTTQYVSEAEECDLVALVSEGRLIAFGTPDQLRAEADRVRPPRDDEDRKTFDEVFVDLVRLQARASEKDRSPAGRGRNRESA